MTISRRKLVGAAGLLPGAAYFDTWQWFNLSNT